MLASVGSVVAAPVLPPEMERAIRSAMQTHPEVMLADAQMLSARAQVAAGDYRWFPRAEVAASSGKSGDRYSAIGLRQTLWDAGRLDADFDVVKASESAAVSGKYAAMESVGMAASIAYLNVARTREQLIVARQNVEEHQKLYSSVVKRNSGGIGSKSDVTLATSRLQQAIASTKQWEGELGRAESSYLSVIGDSPPADTLPLLTLWDVPDGKQGVIIGLINRSPSLQKIREEVKAAEATVNSRKAQLYPTLYARVDNTHYFGSGPMDNDTRFSINFEWQNDVALSQRYQIEAAQHMVMASNRMLESEERKLTEAARNYWEDYITALNRSDELARFQASAIETVQLFKRQFTIGRRSWPEVMNSLQDLYSAQNQRVDAKYQAMSSRLRLAFVSGEMDSLLGNQSQNNGQQ
jgi:adhesin transport system outer membrane protein